MRSPILLSAIVLSAAVAAVSSTVYAAVEQAVKVTEGLSAIDGAGNASEALAPVATAVAPPTVSWGNYFQAVGVLLLVLGALYMGLWVLKRYGKLQRFGGRRGRLGLSLEGQFHIGPKKTLVVVRFLNKRLLLGVTDHQINLLTEMEAEHDATNDADEVDFRALLDEAGNGDTPS